MHGLPSSQAAAVVPETQTPPAHASPPVHTLPSEQTAASSFVCVQPHARSQPSAVQPLPSSQSSATPPTQTPFLQVSDSVQPLPSSHAAVEALCWHPVATLQESAVQTLSSSQSRIPPEAHTLFTHVSPSVHALPSVHVPAVGKCTQPVIVPQLSVVQGLPSSQA